MRERERITIEKHVNKMQGYRRSTQLVSLWASANIKGLAS